MYDNLTNEQVGKIKKSIGIAKRFLEKLLIFTIFNQFIFFVPIIITKDPFEGFFVTKWIVIVGVIVSFLLFYSATRMTTVYYEGMADRFLDLSPAPEGFGRKLSFMFAQKEVKIELILFGMIYLILPPKLLNAGYVWLFAGFGDGIIARIKVLSIILPILFMLYVLANLSAMNYWNKEERKSRDKYKDLSDKEISERKKSEKRERIRFKATLIFGYFFGSLVLIFFVPSLLITLSPILTLLLDMKILIITLLIVFFPWLFRNARAIFKRWKFLRQLKKLCRERKYRLSKIKSPYKSLFKPQEGESFSVYIQKKRYACKLITGKKRSQPIYIMPNGTAAFLIKIRFLRLVLFSYTKSFDFSYEADCKKVLIINPIPQRVLLPRAEFDDLLDERSMLTGRTAHRAIVTEVSNKSTDSHELDNGDIVGGYEIYSARAFLNALERDCIDID